MRLLDEEVGARRVMGDEGVVLDLRSSSVPVAERDRGVSCSPGSSPAPARGTWPVSRRPSTGSTSEQASADVRAFLDALSDRGLTVDEDAA